LPAANSQSENCGGSVMIKHASPYHRYEPFF